MLFSDFAEYLEELEKTSSRIEITNIISSLFEKSSLEEVDKLVYLSLGMLAPNYQGRIINMAEKMMIRVISEAYGIDQKEVVSEYKKMGDLGEVAKVYAKEKTDSLLTIEDVYKALLGVADDAGEGSQERKVEKMIDLLVKLDRSSVKFVVRIPVGKLRLGFSEKTIIDALSNGDKEYAAQIETSYNIRPDIGYIAKLVKSKKIKEAKPEVGTPVVPMLAQRLNSTTEMVKKMGEVAVEPKYDGLRIFIHFRRANPSEKGDFVRIFTRNMNAIEIETFPELLKIGEHLNCDSAILDTEAVGVDAQRELFLDFQTTIQRRRKHQVEKARKEIPLQFQAFDILLLDGESLIAKPYLKRREMLTRVVKNSDLIKVDESTITNDPQVIQEKHQTYIKRGLEGVVVKKANGLYVSGRTGWNWVKMKEEEGKLGRLSDTVDCVIMGFSRGKGKRSGFGVGQFLAGIRKDGLFLTVTKVGTGLTDEQFRDLNDRLSKIVVKNEPKEYLVDKDLCPDFWVEPNVVVELAADEITVSPKHTSGYALRFPRLIKFRDDKGPQNTTTVNELVNIKETSIKSN